MPSAIGVRGYEIYLTYDRSAVPLRFDDAELKVPIPDFFDSFISKHTTSHQSDELERSWFFEQNASDGTGSSRGYVNYGTFGFASNFIDARTKRRNYRRKVTDVEEIPLFYEFWCPPNAHYALAIFQSFQGRSCIGIVMEAMKASFEVINPGFQIRYRKLLPASRGGGVYAAAPVKGLKLIQRDISGDLEDRYLGRRTSEAVDMEVTLTARRRGNLGPLEAVLGSLRTSDAGVITHDGLLFDQAVAEVRVGKKTRPVHIFGHNTEAGVIDLTESTQKGVDGHPTFESISRECDLILKDFHQLLSRRRS